MTILNILVFYSQDIIDIRNNTITALFNDAITLSHVNGSFYWSNGSVLMGEDYFMNEQKYYQNIYPAMHFSYNLILSNFSDQQPIPIPRNPPQSLQAVSTSSKLKATWQVPHLLGGQGKYKLIIIFNIYLKMEYTVI